jgi:Putative transposase
LSLNTHLHALVLDGVYHTGEDGAPVFLEAAAPSREQLQALLGKLITRILRLLTRLGHLIEEDGITYLARNDTLDPHDTMAPLQAAASTWRIAAGPRAGRKVLTLVGATQAGVASRGSRVSCAPTTRDSACTPGCTARPMTAKA